MYLHRRPTLRIGYTAVLLQLDTAPFKSKLHANIHVVLSVSRTGELAWRGGGGEGRGRGDFVTSSRKQNALGRSSTLPVAKKKNKSGGGWFELEMGMNEKSVKNE